MYEQTLSLALDQQLYLQLLCPDNVYLCKSGSLHLATTSGFDSNCAGYGLAFSCFSSVASNFISSNSRLSQGSEVKSDLSEAEIDIAKQGQNLILKVLVLAETKVWSWLMRFQQQPSKD